jgi:hypothetical protein
MLSVTLSTSCPSCNPKMWSSGFTMLYTVGPGSFLCSFWFFLSPHWVKSRALSWGWSVSQCWKHLPGVSDALDSIPSTRGKKALPSSSKILSSAWLSSVLLWLSLVFLSYIWNSAAVRFQFDSVLSTSLLNFLFRSWFFPDFVKPFIFPHISWGSFCKTSFWVPFQALLEFPLLPTGCQCLIPIILATWEAENRRTAQAK